jgi:hypothetical protein
VVRGGLGWASHGEQEVTGVEEGAAVAFDAGGARGNGKGEEWEGLEPKKLTGTKTGRGREETPAFATAAASYHSAGARAGREKGVASARRPEEERLGRRSDWGRRVEVKAAGGGEGRPKTAGGGAAAEEQRAEGQSREAEERQRKKKRGRGPSDLVGIFKNLRDSFVK